MDGYIEPKDAESKPQAQSKADICAEDFVNAYRNRFRYDHDHGRWHEWDGSIWRPDATAHAFHQAKLICRSIAPKQVTASFVAGVAKLAAAHPAIAVSSDIWDRDAFLLGTPDGTVDLRAGVLRDAIPSEYISKTTAIPPAPEADCPLWLKFLDEALQGDADTIRFLQQWSGYSLTGDTREEALIFLHGEGGNGKSVFVGAFQEILDRYAKAAPMETFTAGHNGFTSILSFDIASLAGARLVTAAETKKGREWDEAKLKWLTGRDVVTARFVGGNFFSFVPRFKLTISGNHKPILKNPTQAMMRRLNIVPFNYTPDKPDMKLRERLVAEYPGILRWMIKGCLDWQTNGLVRSQVMIDATAEYFKENDPVGSWLADRCERDPSYADTRANLMASWHSWLAEADLDDDDPHPTDAEVIKQLESRGCKKIKDCLHLGKTRIRGRGMAGVRVRQATRTPADPEHPEPPVWLADHPEWKAARASDASDGQRRFGDGLCR